MDFLNRYFLIGLIGALVPILIYLLTRQRVKKVAFSTLRFFAGVSATLVRRKKTQEMILLAMRVAVCVLLALAFARPLLVDKNAPTVGEIKAERGRVIVADVSGSMARADIAGKLRDGVRQALSESPAGTAVALVTFDKSAKVLVAPTLDRSAADAQVDQITPGQGGTDISVALRKADELLQQVKAPQKDVVLLSDLQRSGWERYQGDWRFAPGVKLDVRVPSDDKPAIAVITGADVPQSVVADSSQKILSVRIANPTGEEMRDLPVTLAIADKEIETRKVTVPANGQVPVRFRHVFDQPGDSAGKISIADKDAANDPERNVYFNTRVIPKIRILILTASSAEDPGLWFLKTALMPSDESPFVVEMVPAASVATSQVDRAGVVILADVASVLPQVHSALAGVLNRGGGLFFMPGGQCKADAFNNGVGQLAPAKLRRTVTAAESRASGSKATVTTLDYDHPIFEVFQRPHYGDFAAVGFDQYWEVTDSQLCRVSARFDDGRPMLLERPIGGGVAMMMVSPADLKWSNLPVRAIFLPYLHETMRYLALRTERQTAWLAGDSLPISKGMSLRDPAGQVHQGDSYVADRVGLWKLLDAQGKDVITYAVNQDPAEAVPGAVEPKEIVAALQRDAVDTQAGVARDAGAASKSALSGKELWLYALAAVLLLGFAELTLANRTAEQ